MENDHRSVEISAQSGRIEPESHFRVFLQSTGDYIDQEVFTNGGQL
jgi:hypothetical protein